MQKATSTLIIAVGSTSPPKVEAVKGAFAAAFPGRLLEIEALSTESGVPDQPVGDDETRRGAVNRARGAWMACRARCDFAVGMEGGVHEEPVVEGSGIGVGVDKNMYCFAWMAVLGRSGGGGTGDSSHSTGNSVNDDGSSDRGSGRSSSGSSSDHGGGDAGDQRASIATAAAAAGAAAATEQRLRWGLGRSGSFAVDPRISSLVRGGVELGVACDQVYATCDGKRSGGLVGVVTGGVVTRAAFYSQALVLALAPFTAPTVPPPRRPPTAAFVPTSPVSQ